MLWISLITLGVVAPHRGFSGSSPPCAACSWQHFSLLPFFLCSFLSFHWWNEYIHVPEFIIYIFLEYPSLYLVFKVFAFSIPFISALSLPILIKFLFVSLVFFSLDFWIFLFILWFFYLLTYMSSVNFFGSSSCFCLFCFFFSNFLNWVFDPFHPYCLI